MKEQFVIVIDIYRSLRPPAPPKGAKVYPASKRGSSKRVGLKGQLAPHCVP